MTLENQYKNKNILIVGASHGIGESLSYKLSDYFANIALVARSMDKLSALENKLNTNAFSIKCNIESESEVEKLGNILKEKWQHIDLVLYCVGTYEPMNIKNFSLEQALNITHINFDGFLKVLNILRPWINAKKLHHLAVISSVSSYFGMPNSLCYGASKAALSHLVESLYYELSNYGAKVQLINPGFVKTRLTEKNKFSMPSIISPEKAAKIIVKKLAKKRFEIAFPATFVLILKCMKLLPFSLRQNILRKYLL